MFATDETDVIEQITRFWIDDEREQDEKMTADANTILVKIDYLHFLRRIYEKNGLEKATAYSEKKPPESFTDDEIRTIDKIAQYWLEYAKEQDKETKAHVNKIRMKIEMWRLDKGREYYERYKFLAMFENEELKVLKKALTGFIAAKSGSEEELETAKSILERLEEP